MEKHELLESLKLDRSAKQEESQRPLKWLLLVALLGGLAFVGWAVDLLRPQPASSPQSGDVDAARAVTQPVHPAASAATSILDATGYVVARRQATVSSKVTGKVLEVYVEEGMRVARGQLLARLDDSIPRAQNDLAQTQLEAARAALEEVQVQKQQAQLDLQRTRGLAAKKLASQADLDRDRLNVKALDARLQRLRQEVKVAQKAGVVQQQLLNDMEVRAPFSGVVVAKAAQPGEMISPVSAGGGFTRTGICTIVDMNSLEVEVDVNEAYINRVKPEQPVAVTLNAYPDFKIPAKVIAIIPTADRSKATVRVRIALLKRDSRVLPDMGVRVAFLAAENTEQQYPGSKS